MRAAVVDAPSQPIRNLAKNTLGSGAGLAIEGTGSATFAGSTEKVRFGASSAKFTWVSGSIGPSVVGGLLALTPGKTYTVSFWVYLESGPVPTFNVHNNVWGNVRAFNGTPRLGEWVRLSRTVTVETNETGIRAYVLIAAPTVMYLDGAMVTEGTTLHDFQDGDTPGWRWTGAVNNSESVGYPYTLESIVGSPLEWRENTSGAVTPSGFTLPSILGNGVTLYVVQDLPGAPPLRGAQYIDSASLDAVTLEHFDGAAPGRSTTARSRGGVTNWRTANNSAVVAGQRSVAAATVSSDGNTASVHGLAAFSSTASPAAQDAVARPCRFVTPQPVVYAGAFRGDHSRETVLRVMGWLGRKYGAPVPAGY